MAVRIDARTVFEPDAFVLCGEPRDRRSIEVDDPVIVVEVMSPSSRDVDTTAKLAEYFRLPSVRHHLVVDSESRSVVHHHRSGSGTIETRILRSGPLDLDPPGLSVVIERFFSD
jgi:Uma2 family endonuclease